MEDKKTGVELESEPRPDVEASALGVEKIGEDVTESQVEAMLVGNWDKVQQEKIQTVLDGAMAQKIQSATQKIRSDETLVEKEATGLAPDMVQAFHVRNEERLGKLEEARKRAIQIFGQFVAEAAEEPVEVAQVEKPKPILAEKKETASNQTSLEADILRMQKSLMFLEGHEQNETVKGRVDELHRRLEKAQKQLEEIAPKVSQEEPEETVEIAEPTTEEEQEVMEAVDLEKKKQQVMEQPTWTTEQWKQEAEAAAKNLEQVQATRAALEARKDALSSAEQAYLTYLNGYAKMAELQKRYAESEATLVQKDQELDAAKAEMKALEEKTAANSAEKQKLQEQKTSAEKRIETLSKQLEGTLTPEERNRYASDVRRLRGELTALNGQAEEAEKAGVNIAASRELQAEKVKGMEKDFEGMLTAQELLQGERDASLAEEKTARQTYELALAAVASSGAFGETSNEATTEKKTVENNPEAASVGILRPTIQESRPKGLTVTEVGAVPLAMAAGVAESAGLAAGKTADFLDWLSKKLGRPKWMGAILDKFKHGEKGRAEKEAAKPRENYESDEKMTKEQFAAWAQKNDLPLDWVESYLTLTDDGKIVSLLDVSLEGLGLHTFPKGISDIEGDLSLKDVQITNLKNLPKRIGGDLILVGASAKWLPPGLNIHGEVIVGKDQEELAENATRRGYRVRVIE